MSFIFILIPIGVLLLLGILGLGVLIFGRGENEKEERAKYKYTAKRSIMTPAEQDFFNTLGMAVGQEYRIFTQVHLSSLVDEKVKGQDWRAARAHINRKSVDFVLCDKETLSTKLAIEVDDKTHEREERVERDVEVERILKDAGIPLLRVPNHGKFEVEDVANQIRGVFAR